jgi:hypothetical protein
MVEQMERSAGLGATPVLPVREIPVSNAAQGKLAAAIWNIDELSKQIRHDVLTHKFLLDLFLRFDESSP